MHLFISLQITPFQMSPCLPLRNSPFNFYGFSTVLYRRRAAGQEKVDLALMPEVSIPHRPPPEVSLTDTECHQIDAAKSETSLAFNDLVKRQHSH